MHKKHRAAIAAVTAALTLLPGVTGLAEYQERPVEGQLTKSLPAPAEPTVVDGVVSLSGVLEYETELEMPHYVVNGWALQFDGDAEVLAQLVGKQVTVKGAQFDGVSFLMRRQIVVTELEVTLEGELSYVTDLETPHFELDGFVVEAEGDALLAMAGTRVTLVGTLWDGPSIYMKPVLAVSRVEAAGDAVSVREARGVLRYETELETPHYVVDGWALMMEDKALMERLAGKTVTIKGREFDGVSVLMRKQLVVEEITVELEGTLTEVSDLGAPHLELDGFVILGEEAALRNLSGSAVKLKGSVHMGPSIYMKPVIQVVEAEAVSREVRVPGMIVVKGWLPVLPQGPVVVDGQLMLPLRAIVEAAGGKVSWNGELQAVVAELEGMSTTINIGSRQAGKGQLPAAPALVNGHTMVPVEFFGLLGLEARWNELILSLTPARSR